MKTLLLSFLFCAAVLNNATSQNLYQNTTSEGRQYNPGLNTQNNPVAVFDDVNIASSLIQGSDSVAITNVKFGLQRGPNAPALTVKFYYSPVNLSNTTINNQITVPPVQIGVLNLPANIGTQTDTIVSIGDSINPIFKVKTRISSLYTNYETFFLGMSFSVAGANTTGWKLATPTQSYNNDHLWLYDFDSNQSFGASFSGNPYATYYLQASGYGIVTPLPVTLNSFKAEKNGALNNLSWSTKTEQNNKGFEIQRSSDGNNFSTISFVQSKALNGVSTSSLSYQFTDEATLVGDTYYRLKQVDLDGKATISPAALIKGNNTSTLVISGIYPNPAGKVVNLVLGAPAAQKVTFLITDLAGKVAMQQSSSTIAGNNNFSLDVSKLSSGTYFIKVVCANGCESAVSKLVKQ